MFKRVSAAAACIAAAAGLVSTGLSTTAEAKVMSAHRLPCWITKLRDIDVQTHVSTALQITNNTGHILPAGAVYDVDTPYVKMAPGHARVTTRTDVYRGADAVLDNPFNTRAMAVGARVSCDASVTWTMTDPREILAKPRG